MGGKSKEKDKKKAKRKRGKKFVFRSESAKDLETTKVKRNPFEEISKLKNMKMGKQVKY